MHRHLIARCLLSLVAVVTLVGSWVADYNATHIFNPNWTPHAKFHGGQTLFFSLCAALCTLFYAWRRAGERRENLRAASLFAAIYWVTQGLAILVPGAAFVDPEFLANTRKLFGLPGPQPVLDAVLLACVGAAWLLGRKGAKPA